MNQLEDLLSKERSERQRTVSRLTDSLNESQSHCQQLVEGGDKTIQLKLQLNEVNLKKTMLDQKVLSMQVRMHFNSSG